jgi:hypothetical protein
MRTYTLQVVNEKGKKELALVWYSTSKYHRGGRNTDGLYLDAAPLGGTALGVVAQFIVAVVDKGDSEESSEGNSEESSEDDADVGGEGYLLLCGRPGIGSFELGSRFKRFCEEKVPNYCALKIYQKILIASKKASKKSIQATIINLLKAELGIAFVDVFVYKVSRITSIYFSHSVLC